MKSSIVLLHGWKVEGNRYNGLKQLLEKKNYNVFIPDMPGFNGVPLIKEIMTLDDYVLYVQDYLKKHNLKKVILIGHSFGARIAAKFTYRNPQQVEKLILSGAPLINKNSVKKTVFHTVAITGKKMLSVFPSEAQDVLRRMLYSVIGEMDYYKAGHLKNTFVSIIKENLAPILPQITISTLLIWGGKDSFVPPSIGREIVSKMPHAIIAILPSETHKLPYENPEKFAQKVLSFISP